MTSARAFVWSARAGALALFALLFLCVHAQAQTDPLPSWNEGPAKQTIVELVKATTDKASPKFVPPEARIATFDQDGTTWVEHPIYTQVVYCVERVPALTGAEDRRAVQDSALRRPRGHSEALDQGFQDAAFKEIVAARALTVLRRLAKRGAVAKSGTSRDAKWALMPTRV
jgi:hypothetical protein